MAIPTGPLLDSPGSAGRITFSQAKTCQGRRSNQRPSAVLKEVQNSLFWNTSTARRVKRAAGIPAGSRPAEVRRPHVEGGHFGGVAERSRALSSGDAAAPAPVKQSLSAIS